MKGFQMRRDDELFMYGSWAGIAMFLTHHVLVDAYGPTGFLLALPAGMVVYFAGRVLADRVMGWLS